MRPVGASDGRTEDRGHESRSEGRVWVRESGVQSVERALDILEFLSRSGERWGLARSGRTPISRPGRRTGCWLPWPQRGYVHRNARTRRYGLGLKSLTMAIAAKERIGTLALPFLEDLARASQETANLAVLEGNTTVYVEQAAPPNRMLRTFTEPGNRVPLHSTGTGKALLAHQPPRLVDFIVDRSGLAQQAVGTITEPSQLRAELEEIRRQGYAVDLRGAGRGRPVPRRPRLRARRRGLRRPERLRPREPPEKRPPGRARARDQVHLRRLCRGLRPILTGPPDPAFSSCGMEALPAGGGVLLLDGGDRSSGDSDSRHRRFG